MASFAPVGSSTLQLSSDVSTPLIQHISAPTAGTEYSFVLPSGTKKYRIRTLLDSTVRLAFVSGDTNTDYYPMSYGEEHEQEGLSGSGITVYFQTNKAANTIVVMSWS